jgi:hypothetical protein
VRGLVVYTGHGTDDGVIILAWTPAWSTLQAAEMPFPAFVQRPEGPRVRRELLDPPNLLVDHHPAGT